MREMLRMQARFLFAIGIVGCHGSASTDSSAAAPTTTATIPSASSSAASTTAVATDSPPPTPTTSPTMHGPGMREVMLPDGGTALQRMPFLGRPLRVDGQARVAATSSREDWDASITPNLEPLTTDERAKLAEEWAHDAAAEHASIAAFSRFSLQLLALGAPAELIEAAHAAALDEARHARDAYALASAYAGRAIGPAPLDVNGALAHIADVTLARLVAETFEEGCVGETIAAMAAREKHANYTDLAVHDVLGRVADDEERHAELAWRTVAWAVRVGGEEARTALADAVARVAATPSIAQNAVFSTVILPCANALLAG